jgi:hypothetical protein
MTGLHRAIILALLLGCPALAEPQVYEVSVEIVDFDCSDAPALFEESAMAQFQPGGLSDYLERLAQAVPVESVLLHTQALTPDVPTQQTTIAGSVEFTLGLLARPVDAGTTTVAVEFSLTDSAGNTMAGNTTTVLKLGDEPVSIGSSASVMSDADGVSKPVRQLRMVLLRAQPGSLPRMSASDGSQTSTSSITVGSAPQ